MSAEERDAIRDLCEAVAELAAGTVHLLGKVLSVSERMDAMDGDEP